MAQPYSARFMSGRGATRTETFTVPEGKRAVVRHVVFHVWEQANCSALLRVHGIALTYYLAPGTLTYALFDVRYVAYARETISVQTFGNDVSYAVHGYLFADPVGEPDDKHNVIVSVLPAPIEDLEPEG